MSCNWSTNAELFHLRQPQGTTPLLTSRQEAVEATPPAPSARALNILRWLAKVWLRSGKKLNCSHLQESWEKQELFGQSSKPQALGYHPCPTSCQEACEGRWPPHTVPAAHPLILYSQIIGCFQCEAYGSFCFAPGDFFFFQTQWDK